MLNRSVKRQTCDEDYQRRLIRHKTGKRQAASSTTHAKFEGIAGQTCKGWVLKDLSAVQRAAFRNFAWGQSSCATHVSEYATIIGMPARETTYFTFVRVRGDRRVNVMGPPQVM